jgi:Ca2+-binding EF-hand superfamily protein
LNKLREGLEKHETYVTDKELRYLMDRLDVNKDNKISYSEFVQEITPKSDKPF